MADLFEEVEEQLRSDRYRTLARKVLPWVLAVFVVALAAAVAYWAWDKYSQQSVDKASEQYAAALDAMNQGKSAEAQKLLAELAKSPAAGYKSLALMHLGSAQLGENKPAEAVKLFDQAAEVAPDPVIADAARLKSAFALLDTAPYKDLEARLTPLMEQDRPYRIQAREALAFAKIMAGDTAGARTDFVVIAAALDAPQEARGRAEAARDLIDSGSAKAVPATVKAALALIPSPPGRSAPGPSAPPQQEAPGPK